MNHLPHSLFLTALVLAMACTASATEPAPRRSLQEVEAATRLQVFLDRANFGPGKIDGYYGGFTQKALRLYREAHELPPLVAAPKPEPETAQPVGEKTAPKSPAEGKDQPKEEEREQDESAVKAERPLPLPDLRDMNLDSLKEVFIDYQVTEADQAAVGEMPKTVAAMADVKWLPYATLGEMVAEKFHCDLDFLKELNPGKVDTLKPGDTVKVPNVEPFNVAGIKELPLLDQIAMNREDAEKASDNEEAGDKTVKDSKDKQGSASSKKLTGSKPGGTFPPSAQPAITPAAQIAVQVHTQDNMLRLIEHGKLVAAYPVTIGSDQTKSPQGEWKVRGIARLPDFRYDSSFLRTGERGDKTYLLPPGPNNMVGVVWIALNRRGIGLHGTGEPDSIGRSASHGCVRLANWDVARLATRVRAGVVVSIH